MGIALRNQRIREEILTAVRNNPGLRAGEINKVVNAEVNQIKNQLARMIESRKIVGRVHGTLYFYYPPGYRVPPEVPEVKERQLRCSMPIKPVQRKAVSGMVKLPRYDDPLQWAMAHCLRFDVQGGE